MKENAKPLDPDSLCDGDNEDDGGARLRLWSQCGCRLLCPPSAHLLGRNWRKALIPVEGTPLKA